MTVMSFISRSKVITTFMLGSQRSYSKFIFAVSQAHIIVQDVNDKQPEFSSQEYSIEIAENIAPGTEIITVSATDGDQDDHLFYTIHSYMDRASNGKFRINSETG